MTTKQKLVDTFLKPSLSGATAVLAAKAVYGGGGIEMFGRLYPGSLVLFALGAATSFGAEVVGNYILPLIPNNLRGADAQKKLVEPTLSGLLTWVVLDKVSLNSYATNVGFIQPFVLGAGSNVAADYATSIVKDYVN